MWIDGSAQRVVDEFWVRAGGVVPFPRDLARPIARALPVATVHLPQLSLGTVEAWLLGRGAGRRFHCLDRRVRGCLIAHRGKGVIFVDGADSADEIRFTVAHELAHFLMDYWSVRNIIIRNLGPRAAEVLDGDRPATIDERLAGVFAGAPIGPFTQFMDRDARTGEPSAKIQGLEDRADRVAVAILAPPEAVFTAVRPLPDSFPIRLQQMADVLSRAFGLPRQTARRYAWSLLVASGRGHSIAESLRS